MPLALIAAAFATAPASAAPLSQQAACRQLIRAAEALHLAAVPVAAYHCELYQASRRRVVFALKGVGPGVAEGTSNLVGYYAVDASSGRVYEWDFAEDRRTRWIYGTGRRRITP